MISRIGGYDSKGKTQAVSVLSFLVGSIGVKIVSLLVFLGFG